VYSLMCLCAGFTDVIWRSASAEKSLATHHDLKDNDVYFFLKVFASRVLVEFIIPEQILMRVAMMLCLTEIRD